MGMDKTMMVRTTHATAGGSLGICDCFRSAWIGAAVDHLFQDLGVPGICSLVDCLRQAARDAALDPSAI